MIYFIPFHGAILCFQRTKSCIVAMPLAIIFINATYRIHVSCNSSASLDGFGLACLNTEEYILKASVQLSIVNFFLDFLLG